MDTTLETDELAIKEFELDGYEEALANNPVAQTISYWRFVSKSKGRRNGKQRIRKHWKEVHLIGTKRGVSHGRFSGGHFTQWHLFPFDVYATEILGAQVQPDEAEEYLKNEIIKLWGY